MTMVSDDEVVELYEELKTIRAVADRIGKGRTYVHTRLLRAGVVDYSRPSIQGEGNPNSKLTKEKASMIRKSEKGITEIAEEHEVSVDTVRKIRGGKTWQN